jgi:hypothetical protein
MNIQSGFLVFIFLFNFFLSANISSQTTSSEQKFENAGAQLLWPVNCLSQSGLERLWSSSRNGVYQDTIGVDAVWGSIRKASVIDGQRVVIKGYVGGSVCELFSDAPKREYIWRTESIRDKEAISVYINVRQKTSTARMSKYFKVNTWMIIDLTFQYLLMIFSRQKMLRKYAWVKFSKTVNFICFLSSILTETITHRLSIASPMMSWGLRGGSQI